MLHSKISQTGLKSCPRDLPDAPRPFTGIKNWEKIQQKKTYVTVRKSQHTRKKITSRSNQGSQNRRNVLDNEDYFIGNCPAFARLITQQKNSIIEGYAVVLQLPG